MVTNISKSDRSEHIHKWYTAAEESSFAILLNLNRLKETENL
jgi:hypothetical protein